jgi:hypothetical protein
MEGATGHYNHFADAITMEEFKHMTKGFLLGTTPKAFHLKLSPILCK